MNPYYLIRKGYATLQHVLNANLRMTSDSVQYSFLSTILDPLPFPHLCQYTIYIFPARLMYYKNISQNTAINILA
jgi:hypothetical protein